MLTAIRRGLRMIPLDTLQQFVETAPLILIGSIVGLGFMAIYLGYAGLALVLTRRTLPALGIGALIETRPLEKNQIRSEILRSFRSITIFALYSVGAVIAVRAGFIRLNWLPGFGMVLLNLAILIVWNEIHFYASHRLLHTDWLYKNVHEVHHRSITPTPFSTYSFHWGEALIVSSVMFLIMPVWQLDIIAIIVFPMISLVANSIGHMNYAIFPAKNTDAILAACQRHTAHHTRWKGNYGFYVPWLDQFFGTRIELRQRKTPVD